MNSKKLKKILFLIFILGLILVQTHSKKLSSKKKKQKNSKLWNFYENVLSEAKYIDLTHTLQPDSPVWKGFGPAKFGRSINQTTNQPYTYEKDGFEASSYQFTTDQFGTQLEYPSISEIPPTFSLRPLVVISIVKQCKNFFNYSMQVNDILKWEKKNGKIPQGAVVFVRSDWSLLWPNKNLSELTQFPGVSLEALKFLHLKRKILFHGHEPLDTDASPDLKGEQWLLTNGYCQAEGVANLHLVKQKGCLVTIGFPKLQGGLGGYARFVAICPKNWKYGQNINYFEEAPFKKYQNKLVFNDKLGYRQRKNQKKSSK